MSNLNNFMKNNKGYYSWIHSLNRAAVESQILGAKMLKEQREEGADEDLIARLKDAKMRAGRDTYHNVHNAKNPQARDAAPVGDADDVEDDAEDGVVGQVAIIPHRENDEPSTDTDEYQTRIPTSRLPEIEAGTFPPPSVQHPPAQFPTPEAAAAEVRRLNAPKDAAKVREYHQQEAAKEAKEKVEAGRRAGKGPKELEKIARDAVEAYKARQRQNLLSEPPEESEEVVTPEGQRLMLPRTESVSQKINKFLREEEEMVTDRAATRRPGTAFDSTSAFKEMNIPHGIRKMIKGAPTTSKLFSTLIGIIDNSEQHDPEHVKFANDYFETIARFMDQQR